jgi:hypothetical protein
MEWAGPRRISADPFPFALSLSSRFRAKMPDFALSLPFALSQFLPGLYLIAASI